jgi:hypothetical protein
MTISILEYMHFIHLLVIQGRRKDLFDLLRSFYPDATGAKLNQVVDFLFSEVDTDHVEIFCTVLSNEGCSHE